VTNMTARQRSAKTHSHINEDSTEVSVDTGILGSPGVSAATGTGHQNINCSGWWLLFSPPEVTKGRALVNSRDPNSDRSQRFSRKRIQ
jgi:hypothetical protein